MSLVSDNKCWLCNGIKYTYDRLYDENGEYYEKIKCYICGGTGILVECENNCDCDPGKKCIKNGNHKKGLCK